LYADLDLGRSVPAGGGEAAKPPPAVTLYLPLGVSQLFQRRFEALLQRAHLEVRRGQLARCLLADRALLDQLGPERVPRLAGLRQAVLELGPLGALRRELDGQLLPGPAFLAERPLGRIEGGPRSSSWAPLTAAVSSQSSS
jgi:hypothetical protein